MKSNFNYVAIVTGAARRIGATIAKTLHSNGFNIIVHYRHSKSDAEGLCAALNKLRPNSALPVRVDLVESSELSKLISSAVRAWGRLDLLVNNASEFHPTPVGSTSEAQWDKLINSNLKAPYFLAQLASPHLAKNKGSIINIIDVHGQVPLKGYSAYSISKAGLSMLTKSLARELGPHVRVNGISPGITVWPEEDNALDEARKIELMERTSLKRPVDLQDIANAVVFFSRLQSATGQILNIDSGRLIQI